MDFFRKPLYDDHYINPLEFKMTRNRKNMEHGVSLSIFIIMMELVFITIAVNSYITSAYIEFSYVKYISMYLFMILISLGFLTFAKKANLNDPSEKSILIINHGIIFYNIILALWGTSITLIDQALYSNLNAFFVNLVVVATLFYHNRRTMLTIFIVSVLPLFILLPFFQLSTNVLIGHYVNGTVIICFMGLASRLIYNSFVQNHNANCELKIAFERLSKTTSIDALTGLSNRYGLTTYLASLGTAEDYSCRLIGIIMLDIDSFKAYNDVHGHIEGDRVLVELGRVLNEATFGSDILTVRFGGEEFLVLCENKNTEETLALAEKIRLAASNIPVGSEVGCIKSPITISAGAVSLEICHPQFIWTAIERADKLLYVSKTTGKNKVTV